MTRMIYALLAVLAIALFTGAAAAAEPQQNQAAYLGWEEMHAGVRYQGPIGNVYFEQENLTATDQVIKVHIFLAAAYRQSKSLVVFLNLTGPQYQTLIVLVDPNKVEQIAYFSVPVGGVRNISVFPSTVFQEEGFFSERMVKP